MKYEEIKKIIKDFEASTLYSLELEIEDIKVKMAKYPVAQPQTIVQPQTQNVVVSPDTPQIPPAKSNGTSVKSPLVGTFYASPSPEAGPFVRVGDTVKKGDTLCIIEAMKIMNEISAPVSGKIESIHAKNNDAIGFDQVLFVIDHAK